MTVDEIIDRVAEVAGVKLTDWQRSMARQVIESHATGNAVPGMRVPRRNGMAAVREWEAAYRRLLNDYRVSDYEVRNDNQ